MTNNPQTKASRLSTNEWRSLIKEWEQSNQTQKVFCKERELNLNNFTYHRGQLKKQSKTGAKLMPVKIKAEGPVSKYSQHFILELVDSKKLAIPQRYDAAALRDLLKLLEGSVC